MPDWQDVNEAELLLKARQGDAQAFGELYEAYAPRLFRYLFAHLENRLDAEDLTEDVFLRVWQALPAYREQGIPFAGFVFRVARNALIDHYRRTRRRKPDLETDSIEEFIPDPTPTLQAHLEHKEMREALGKLREEYRMVLNLRFLADLSPEETAQAMGRSAGAVRVLQHRALAALRKLLEKLEEAK